MSDVKKIATRETYGKTLVELGAEMPNLVVLDADLAGATKTGVFKKAYPDRHPFSSKCTDGLPCKVSAYSLFRANALTACLAKSVQIPVFREKH